MYIQFFKLNQAPFSIAPDPHYLYMSERHREALALLLYGVTSGGGFVLLTGEIGAGKTTVCRCFLQQVPQNCNLAYIFNPKLTVDELLQAICDEFGIRPGSDHKPSVKEYVDALNDFLLAAHAQGRNNVLIIDEAQNLTAEVLEQLRLLTNLETSECKLLQIILIGQPELRGMLARPELEQLAQRVIARYHLDSLSEPETARYILHRLSVAGLVDESPFNVQAMRLIHRIAKGVPRRINLLCDRALLGAYAQGKHKVDRAIVKQAAQEVFGQRPAARKTQPVRDAVLGVLLGAAMTGATLAAIGSGYTFKAFMPHGAAPAAAKSPGGAAAASVAGTAAVQKKAAVIESDRASPAAPAPAAALTDVAGWLSGVALQNEAMLYPELGRLWGASLPDGETCRAARDHDLRCYKGSASLAEIRQLDRPAILQLRDDTNQIHHVLLVGLTPGSAILRLAGKDQPVSLVALDRAFSGEFATLWRVPKDFRAYLKPGDQGPDVDWLAQQLAKLNGAAKPAPNQPLDQAMTRQVREFQVAQGLQADGSVGPRTLMHLNSAAGANEPRLQSGTAAAGPALGK